MSPTTATPPGPGSGPADFIRQIVSADVANGVNAGQVITRFPPEPNGYLHIGHAKAICLNFGLAAEYDGGHCYLRFDDTNPTKESLEYVRAIEEDVRWLGFDWGSRLTHASDYFEQLYEFALRLVAAGKAYVDDLSGEQIRELRGSLTEPGRESPCRDRSAQENLNLLQRMRAGEFAEGERVLRAKIDMSSPNMNLRDPVMYRVLHRSHQMTGERWCIYPMYDWAHGQCDHLEGVTHSLCTLEFEDHRALYDWFVDALALEPRPRQYEFSRLKLDHTVLSKRLLNRLVDEGHVSGWDDPRMPTLRGMRRRGYTPASIRDLCRRVGVTKKNHVVEVGVLENCIREDLDALAPRVMCVQDPLRVVIVNYPEDERESFTGPNHPRDASMGERAIPFSRVVYVERDDFAEDPPRKFHRLAPGREVRLRYACLITCVDVVKDPETGEVVELRCTYDPDSRGGAAPDGRKVRGTLHWVSAEHALPVELRLYDRLFQVPDPGAVHSESDFVKALNPDSVVVLAGALIEPSVAEAAPGARYQFERQGYYCVDSKDSAPNHLVFNRTVTLRDTWAKIESRQKSRAP